MVYGLLLLTSLSVGLRGVWLLLLTSLSVGLRSVWLLLLTSLSVGLRGVWVITSDVTETRPTWCMVITSDVTERRHQKYPNPLAVCLMTTITALTRCRRNDCSARSLNYYQILALKLMDEQPILFLSN